VNTYALIGLLGTLIAANLLHLTGSYRREVQGRVHASIGRAVAAWCCTSAVVAALCFATIGIDASVAVWLAAWAILGTAALVLIRAALHLQLYKWQRDGRLSRGVVVYGLGPIGQQLLARFKYGKASGVRVFGVFDDVLPRVPTYCCGVPFLGDIDALQAFVRSNPVDAVIVALPCGTKDRMGRILDRLATLPVDVRLCLAAVASEGVEPSLDEIGGLPLLRIADRPLSDLQRIAKALEDRVLGSIILVSILPVMLAIALLIKLDTRGPVLFRQRRYGFNNQLIEVFKFRTMHHDRTDRDAEQLTCRNDLRVTRVGSFLRRTSLDELPQFFNVVRGEMSIVGPRPHACRAKAEGVLYQDAVRNYSARHRVKPGITGLAQVNGWRGETRTVEQIQKRVENDLAYIDNWSLWLDAKIIAKTIVTGFTGKQAY
jgi:Undecaprenyl-phosphate glucose phosphotransferase